VQGPNARDVDTDDVFIYYKWMTRPSRAQQTATCTVKFAGLAF